MNKNNHTTSVNCLLSKRETMEVLKWAIRTRNASYIEHTLDFESLDAETRRLCELTYAACKAVFAKTLNESELGDTTNALWSYCYVNGDARVLLDMLDEVISNRLDKEVM